LNAKWESVTDFGDQTREPAFFENQPPAAKFSDTTGPLVVGNVVV
jgi:hypothetical protein